MFVHKLAEYTKTRRTVPLKNRPKGFRSWIQPNSINGANPVVQSCNLFIRSPCGKGESNWLHGLDLLRLQNEETFMRGALDYQAPNMFAGSLFDLAKIQNTKFDLSFAIPMGLRARH
jgi:hypothetical protein